MWTFSNIPSNALLRLGFNVPRRSWPFASAFSTVSWTFRSRVTYLWPEKLNSGLETFRNVWECWTLRNINEKIKTHADKKICRIRSMGLFLKVSDWSLKVKDRYSLKYNIFWLKLFKKTSIYIKGMLKKALKWSRTCHVCHKMYLENRYKSPLDIISLRSRNELIFLGQLKCVRFSI